MMCPYFFIAEVKGKMRVNVTNQKYLQNFTIIKNKKLN